MSVLLTTAETEGVVRAIADGLLPEIWKLRLTFTRLPEGRSRDVVEAALLKVDAARQELMLEAEALTPPRTVP